MAVNLSISAQGVKHFQSLKLKKFRQKYGQFVVEGTKSVLELLHSDMLVDEIAATSEWIEEFKEELNGVDSYVATMAQIKRMTSFKSPSPVMAIAQSPGSYPLPKTGWIMALDGISDPGNLGTIIRIADWYGISDLVCSENTVEYLNPKVLTSAMGSFTRIRLHYTNLSKYLPDTNLPIFACVMNGDSVYDMKAVEGIILIGSESHGISDQILSLPVKKITIPSIGKAESLNAAAATAIVCDRLIGHPK